MLSSWQYPTLASNDLRVGGRAEVHQLGVQIIMIEWNRPQQYTTRFRSYSATTLAKCRVGARNGSHARGSEGFGPGHALYLVLSGRVNFGLSFKAQHLTACPRDSSAHSIPAPNLFCN